MADREPRRRLGVVAMVLAMAAAVAVAWVWMNSYADRAARKASPPTVGESISPPLPSRPSLAVLPFRNINNDPEEDYLSDGIPERMAQRLGENGALFVINPRSAIAYKGRDTAPAAIGRALGVSHLLTGAVQKLAGFLKIQARLVRADTGAVVWSKEFDGVFPGVFRYQEEIVARVSSALLGAEQAPGRDVAAGQGPRDSMVGALAYEKYLKARDLARRYEWGTTAIALQNLRDALELNPRMALVQAELGWRYLESMEQGWLTDRAEALARAGQWAGRARRTAPHAAALALRARLALLKNQGADTAVQAATRAVKMAPNDARAHATLAWSLALGGRAARAVPHMNTALRLSPHAEDGMIQRAAWVHLLARRCDAALAEFATVARLTRRPLLRRDARLGAILCHMERGREDEARRLARGLPLEESYLLGTVWRDWAAMFPGQNRLVDAWMLRLAQAGVRE